MVADSHCDDINKSSNNVRRLMANSGPNIVAFIALFGVDPLDLGAVRALAGAARRGDQRDRRMAVAAAQISRSSRLSRLHKATAATAGILLGTLIFEPNRLLTFRLRWFDLPMLLWSLCPFVSSVSNESGDLRRIVRSAPANDVLVPAVPWSGRLYLTDVEDMRELALGMIVGGVCLIPLCLFEFKMSPILQLMVYGIGGWEGARYGGYRPRVFFEASLELGLWMNAVTLVAWWFWRTGQLKRPGRTCRRCNRCRAADHFDCVQNHRRDFAVLHRYGGALDLPGGPKRNG